MDLSNLGERQIKIDCDVIQADGGTRTASISGGFISLYLAIEKLKNNYNLQKPIIKNFIGAVSTGIVENKALLDLDYREDSEAQVDANFVICDSDDISEYISKLSLTPVCWCTCRLSNRVKERVLQDIKLVNKIYTYDLHCYDVDLNQEYEYNGKISKHCKKVNICYGNYKTSREDNCTMLSEERAWSSPIYVNFQ